MSDRPTIFRPEALEHRTRGPRQGGVIRLAPRWTGWAFWALIALVVTALGVASQIEIERYASGTTTVDRHGQIVVLVPAALAPQVAPGRLVDLGTSTAEVVSSGDTILYPAEMKERYGIDVAVPSVALVTSATAADETDEAARVLVESEPLIVALVPGLKALVGAGDG